MSKLYITDHPLIQYKLTLLRSSETGNKEFRELVSEIASLIFYEATKDIPLENTEVETPMGKADGKTIASKIGLVSILRAGLGMMGGILSLVPNANVGHIGLYRDPVTLMPIEYYCKVPSSEDTSEIMLIDPMLATGGSAGAAVSFLKERGFKTIKIICIIAAPEGVKRISEEHPDVDIYAAALDRGLNEQGYIIPGLGDAGNRLFGTK